MNSQTTDNAIIRASELGEYVYCARAWWLHRQQGVASRNVAAMQNGRAAHEEHGRAVASILTQRRLALLLAALAGLTAVAAIILAIGGGA
jgi:hypothetical protein